MRRSRVAPVHEAEEGSIKQTSDEGAKITCTGGGGGG